MAVWGRLCFGGSVVRHLGVWVVEWGVCIETNEQHPSNLTNLCSGVSIRMRELRLSANHRIFPIICVHM